MKNASGGVAGTSGAAARRREAPDAGPAVGPSADSATRGQGAEVIEARIAPPWDGSPARQQTSPGRGPEVGPSADSATRGQGAEV
ncbi:MAG TPA: hypothetical protein VGL02_06100, partial [Streptomyces sp.]